MGYPLNIYYDNIYKKNKINIKYLILYIQRDPYDPIDPLNPYDPPPPRYRNVAADYEIIGTFRALNSRNIQTFEIAGEDTPPTAAKYLKVEVRSHYGTEHFCPLSVFRVYGTNADEPDEYELVPLTAEDIASNKNGDGSTGASGAGGDSGGNGAATTEDEKPAGNTIGLN